MYKLAQSSMSYHSECQGLEGECATQRIDFKMTNENGNRLLSGISYKDILNSFSHTRGLT